jgi:hypothetical protein
MIPPPPLRKFSSSKLCPHLQAKHKLKIVYNQYQRFHVCSLEWV